MSAAQRIIDDPAALSGLSVLRSRGRIRLDLQGLPEDDRLSWEKRLNRACRATGNGETMIGFLVGFLLGLLVFGQALADGSLGWTGAAAVLIALIVPSIIGKLVGLIKAQLRLRGLVADLLSQWPTEPLSAGKAE